MIINKLLFVIRLAAIILAFFVAAEQTEKFIILGCYICLVDMIMLFIGLYIHKLPDKLVMYLIDIAFTIPWWCFIAQFMSTSAWFAAAIFLLPCIGGFIGVYYNHKIRHQSLTKAIN